MTLREFIDWVGTAAGFFPKERQPVPKQPVEQMQAEAKRITEEVKQAGPSRAKHRRKAELKITSGYRAERRKDA